MMRKILGLIFALLCAPAHAQIVGTLPFTLQNGTIADANQVMANLNAIAAGVNASAATSGANSNITSLIGLTTPLSYTSGGAAYYIGGLSSNVSNAYTVASPIPSGFTLTSGKRLSFIASATNTGASTLAANATAATNIYRASSSGPVPLVGGEIVANNLVEVVFDGTQYQLVNQVQTGVPPAGAMLDYAGSVIPSGWLAANGQSVSRTTYSILNAALSVTGVAATLNSSTTIAVPNSALFQVGWFVGGTNVTCNSTIQSIPDGTHVVINNAAGATGASTLQIGPWNQGDCSTTFQVPNMVGRASVYPDGSTNLTSTTCTNPGTLGSLCGAQTVTLLTANLPPYTPAGTNSVPTNTGSGKYAFGNSGGSLTGGGAAQGPVTDLNLYTITFGAPVFTGTAQGGTSTPVNKIPPIALVYKIIKY
jgi:hypothetical protein